MVSDLDDGLLVFEVLALLLLVVRGDAFWVVIRNDSRVSKLIGERFGSSDKVVKVLEFCTNSFNAESNAIFAFSLCRWRCDQWFDRIVFREGVRYSGRWRVRVILPVLVQVVTEFGEFFMGPVHCVSGGGVRGFMWLPRGV